MGIAGYTFLVLCLFSFSTDSTAASITQYILDARKPNQTKPKFLFQAKTSTTEAKNNTLIVFVHGLFGDTVKTWESETGNSLPHALKTHFGFSSGYEFFAFGYPSSLVKKGSFSVSEAAKALKTEWDYRGFADYGRVIIVAHSMGGLVALETLTTYSDIREKVPLLVTYATPYNGAQLSLLASQLVRNPGLYDMIPGEDKNGFILSLTNRWKELKSTSKTSTIIKCAYETVPIPVIGLIVPSPSGSALCDGAADPVGDDHLGIVKPDSDSHQSIKVLVNAIRSLTKKVSTSETIEESVLIKQVEARGLTPDAAFAADKLHQHLTQELMNAGHRVSAPPQSIVPNDRKASNIFAISASQLEETLSLKVTLSNADGSLVASTDVSGLSPLLAVLYQYLPRMVLFGLDIDPKTLQKKNSKRLPTNNNLAFGYYLFAKEAAERGDPSVAQNMLRQAISVDNRFAMAYWSLGELVAREGRVREGKALIEKARKIDPDHPRVETFSSKGTSNPLPDVMRLVRSAKLTKLRDGLLYSRVRSDVYKIDIGIWMLNSRKVDISVVEQSDIHGSSVNEYLKDSSVLIGINGGFFERDTEKRLSPSGILVVDGIVRNSTPNDQSGALVKEGGKVGIVWAREVKDLSNYSAILQSGPLLVEPQGKMGIRSNNYDRHNRAAICLRGDDVILVSVHGLNGRGLSLFELATLLVAKQRDGGINCERALNLDGGPSAQVAYRRDEKVEFVPGVWKVQNALVVRGAAASN